MRIINGLFFLMIAILVSDCSGKKKHCKADIAVSAGYIDSSWTYRNPQFGLLFQMPDNWYLSSNGNSSLANLTRVGASINYLKGYNSRNITYTLRDSARYIGENFVPLFSMKTCDDFTADTVGNANCKSSIYFMDFAIIKSETDNVHSDLKKLINNMIKTMSYLPGEKTKMINSAYKDIHLGNTVFYSNTTVHENPEGKMYRLSAMKNLGCVYLVISAVYKEKDQQNIILKALSNFEITNLQLL
jgi:hypothetical protein